MLIHEYLAGEIVINDHQLSLQAILSCSQIFTTKLACFLLIEATVRDKEENRLRSRDINALKGSIGEFIWEL
jgi:hypothetical protein